MHLSLSTSNDESRPASAWRDPSMILLVVLSVAIECGGAALGIELLITRHHAAYCTILRTVGYVMPSCWR